MDEQEILKFIFNKVSKDMIELECDNTTILEKLHEKGLISEQERHSCVTHKDKNV